MPAKITDLVSSFWLKVQKTESCWIWKAGISHGLPCLNRAHFGTSSSRQIAWTLVKGEIPVGLNPSVVCGNDLCVNPEHMELKPRVKFCRGSLADRFWARVEKGETCWIFSGGTGISIGYGALGTGGRGGPLLLAHRVSWEIHFGIIPDGLKVLHKCDVPRCVNPDHLFLGTHQDNMDDAVAKGRMPRGEQNCASRLEADTVREIRALFAQGLSQAELCAKYSLVASHVHKIVSRKQWRHI